MKSTYCEYILEKILSTSEVGLILALIAPSPLYKLNIKCIFTYIVVPIIKPSYIIKHTQFLLLLNLCKFLKRKPEFSDILCNPTHFPGPLVCRIRQVPLYIYLFRIMQIKPILIKKNCKQAFIVYAWDTKMSVLMVCLKRVRTYFLYW
jgi:hypothetical protein